MDDNNINMSQPAYNEEDSKTVETAQISTEQTLLIPPQPTLLGIPQELRDIITSYILLKPTNTITMLPNFSCYANEISASQPPLTAVCKQLRSECLPAFYSGNTFNAQLDNDQDLETALSWLAAIGDANVGDLGRLIFCGWTRIPFGHMMTKRWVRIVLDFKKGELEVESMEGDYGTCGHVPGKGEVAEAIRELKGAFKVIVGRGVGGREVGELMRGFRGLCEGY